MHNIEDSKYLLKLSSYVIVVLNLLLRFIIIYVFNKTGFNTETSKMTYITIAIFMSQFFNTGLQAMLINSNLLIFRGNDPDFNSRWFKNVGDPIVTSLYAQMYLPFITLASNWGVIILKRCFDKRKFNEKGG